MAQRDAKLFAGVLFAILIAGAPNAPAAQALDGLPEVHPESAGFSSQRLQRVDAWMQKYVDEGKLAGMAMAITHRGKVVYVRHVGFRDRENQLALSDDTLYRIFSMTKPVTGVALMTLFEEGKFQLDDPVADYLPEFKNVKVYAGTDKSGKILLQEPRRPMTIRHLLTHTAGLSYGDTKDPVDQLYSKKNVFDFKDTLAEFTRKLSELPLVTHPGEMWRYSYAVDVQGRLVEVISGVPFDQYVRTHILTPLKMDDTTFILSDAERARLSVAYRRNAADTGIEPMPIPAAKAIANTGEMRLMSGGGGLISTLGDYLRFTQMLVNSGELQGVRILGPKTVDLMMMDHVPANTGPKPGDIEGYGFGLGGAVLRNVTMSQLPGTAGEYTWAGSASTIFWVDRKEQLGVVMMAQLHPGSTYPLRKELKALVYQALIDTASSRHTSARSHRHLPSRQTRVAH